MSQQYPFSTEPLPYDYRALEPEIDAETLHFHHDKHLQAYVDNLNKALADYPAYHSWSLEKLLKQGDALPDAWKEKMKNAAVTQFGSGWAWLAMDGQGRLHVLKTANQDTPLTLHMCPLLPVDVWEHAYYLQYQNRRPEYVDRWFSLINWKQVEEQFAQCSRC